MTRCVAVSGMTGGRPYQPVFPEGSVSRVGARLSTAGGGTAARLFLGNRSCDGLGRSFYDTHSVRLRSSLRRRMLA